MRLVIAQMKHETNTFSPVPTPLARFAHGRALPPEGREVYEAFKGTGTAIGAFIDLADKAGAEAVYPIAGNAAPSAPVENDAYEAMAGRIVDAVAKGCDAVLLDLHGAMVTRSYDDGEGELLGRIRRIAPEVPIGVALDMHTNLFPAMGRLATAIAGYQTYPHVDMYETGMRAARPILSLLQGKSKPVLAFGHRPMLPHVMRQSSLDSPNREIQSRAREMERKGALCASFFVGFPHADIPYAGSSAVVVTDGDAGQGAGAVRRAARDGVAGARAVRLQDRAARAIAAAREGDGRAPGDAARPLRQLRLRRQHGHDGGAGRHSRRGTGGGRRVRDLRPAGGRADEARGRGRAGDASRSAARWTCRRSA